MFLLRCGTTVTLLFRRRIEGSAKFTRSPIVIDNRGNLLVISVVRRPVDPVAAIHLKLKVPEKRSHVTSQCGVKR